MELIRPSEIIVGSVVQQLLNELDELCNRIDECRPLSTDLVERIERELLGDRVYQSNSIEGNTHTIQETQAILQSGQIIDAGRRREGQEVLNLGEAIAFMQGLITNGDLTQEDFCEAHRRLLQSIDDSIAGSIRQVGQRVMIAGAKHQPPRGEKVAGLIAAMFTNLDAETSTHPVIVATWLHWSIARIHPFHDGNGRMARLWQDTWLLRNHYTPAVIPQSQRKLYYDSLRQADDGDFTELLQLVIQSATQTAQLYLSAIRESDALSDWASDLAREADELNDDARKLQYIHWRNSVTEIRQAFERCVVQFQRQTTKIDMEFHRYEIIDQATWELLRSEPAASQTWCFRIACRSATKSYQYVFFAGKHFPGPEDDAEKFSGPLVSLFISEKCGASESVVLNGGVGPIWLREILCVDREIARKRWDKNYQAYVFDRATPATKIAQDFLTEVVLHRLTE